MKSWRLGDSNLLAGKGQGIFRGPEETLSKDIENKRIGTKKDRLEKVRRKCVQQKRELLWKAWHDWNTQKKWRWKTGP